MLSFECSQGRNKQKGEKRNTKIINIKTEFRNKVIKKPTAKPWKVKRLAKAKTKGIHPSALF